MTLLCNGCGTETAASYHMDHIVPKVRGGSNCAENFQILCRACNLSKSTLTMREWVKVPNARCRAHWWWRIDQAPMGVRETKIQFPIKGRLKDIGPDLPSVSQSQIMLTEALNRGFSRGDRVWIEGGILEGISGTCIWMSEFGVKIQLFSQRSVLFIPEDWPFRLVNRNKEESRFKTKSSARRSRRRLSNLQRGLG